MDTDIRLAVTRNMRELLLRCPAILSDPKVAQVAELLAGNPTQFDPRAFFAPVMETVMYGVSSSPQVEQLMQAVEAGVKEVVGTLLVAFGTYGKARQILRKMGCA